MCLGLHYNLEKISTYLCVNQTPLCVVEILTINQLIFIDFHSVLVGFFICGSPFCIGGDSL